MRDRTRRGFFAAMLASGPAVVAAAAVAKTKKPTRLPLTLTRREKRPSPFPFGDEAYPIVRFYVRWPGSLTLEQVSNSFTIVSNDDRFFLIIRIGDSFYRLEGRWERDSQFRAFDAVARLAGDVDVIAAPTHGRVLWTRVVRVENVPASWRSL